MSIIRSNIEIRRGKFTVPGGNLPLSNTFTIVPKKPEGEHSIFVELLKVGTILLVATLVAAKVRLV